MNYSLFINSVSLDVHPLPCTNSIWQFYGYISMIWYIKYDHDRVLLVVIQTMQCVYCVYSVSFGIAIWRFSIINLWNLVMEKIKDKVFFGWYGYIVDWWFVTLNAVGLLCRLPGEKDVNMPHEIWSCLCIQWVENRFDISAYLELCVYNVHGGRRDVQFGWCEREENRCGIIMERYGLLLNLIYCPN